MPIEVLRYLLYNILDIFCVEHISARKFERIDIAHLCKRGNFQNCGFFYKGRIAVKHQRVAGIAQHWFDDFQHIAFGGADCGFDWKCPRRKFNKLPHWFATNFKVKRAGEALKTWVLIKKNYNRHIRLMIGLCHCLSLRLKHLHSPFVCYKSLLPVCQYLRPTFRGFDAQGLP